MLMASFRVATATIVFLIGLASPAHAADDPIVVRGDNNGGIATNVTDPSKPGSSRTGDWVGSPSHRGGVTCTYEFDGSNYSGGWPQQILNGPPVDGPGWWYYRRCSNG